MIGMRSTLVPVAGLLAALLAGGVECPWHHLVVQAIRISAWATAAAVPESARRAAIVAEAQTPPGSAEREPQTPGVDRMLPTISRIVIAPRGTSTIEGEGTPGSRIGLSVAGRPTATGTVDARGRWRLDVGSLLVPGDHHIEAAVHIGDGKRQRVGDEVRIAIPAGLAGPSIVEFYKGRDWSGASPIGEATRQRAEELAGEASRRFDEIDRALRSRSSQTGGVHEQAARRRVIPPPAAPPISEPASPVPMKQGQGGRPGAGGSEPVERSDRAATDRAQEQSAVARRRTGTGAHSKRAPSSRAKWRMLRASSQACRRRKAGHRLHAAGVYVVRSGDTLWAIARRHYGSGRRYPLIVAANRRRIADPDLIWPCQRLHLPRRARRG